MQIRNIVAILESVAAGVDPNTGERIPNDVFHTPDVIRAFYGAANILRHSGPKEAKVAAPAGEVRTSKAALAGARWNEAEDMRLCEEFEAGLPISEIATQHGRTRGAIESRLVKLGKVDPNSVRVRDRVRFAS